MPISALLKSALPYQVGNKRPRVHCSINSAHQCIWYFLQYKQNLLGYSTAVQQYQLILLYRVPYAPLLLTRSYSIIPGTKVYI